MGTWGNCQRLAVVAIFLDRTLILKTHEWGREVQKQKCRDQAGSDFEYLLTIHNRNRVERNGSPWRKSNLGSTVDTVSFHCCAGSRAAGNYHHDATPTPSTAHAQTVVTVHSTCADSMLIKRAALCSQR